MSQQRDEADSGDAKAQLELGFGYHAAKDFSLAFDCFLVAAAAGNADAQFEVAWRLDKGKWLPPGRTKDVAAALEWYTKAADQQHSTAVIAVARLEKVIRGAAADEALEQRRILAAMDEIAATLVFNQLSPEDSYDAFDSDEDGQLSLSDLLSAVSALQLDIKEKESKDLFESLDAGKTGYIPRAAWVQAIQGANAEDILKSRGVTISEVEAALPAEEPASRLPAGNTAPLTSAKGGAAAAKGGTAAAKGGATAKGGLAAGGGQASSRVKLLSRRLATKAAKQIFRKKKIINESHFGDFGMGLGRVEIVQTGVVPLEPQLIQPTGRQPTEVKLFESWEGMPIRVENVFSTEEALINWLCKHPEDRVVLGNCRQKLKHRLCDILDPDELAEEVITEAEEMDAERRQQGLSVLDEQDPEHTRNLHKLVAEELPALIEYLEKTANEPNPGKFELPAIPNSPYSSTAEHIRMVYEAGFKTVDGSEATDENMPIFMSTDGKEMRTPYDGYRFITQILRAVQLVGRLFSLVEALETETKHQFRAPDNWTAEYKELFASNGREFVELSKQLWPVRNDGNPIRQS